MEKTKQGKAMDGMYRIPCKIKLGYSVCVLEITNAHSYYKSHTNLPGNNALLYTNTFLHDVQWENSRLYIYCCWKNLKVKLRFTQEDILHKTAAVP